MSAAQFLCSFRLIMRPGQDLGWMVHDAFHELGLVVRGEMQVDTPAGRLRVPAGSLILSPRGVWHQPVMVGSGQHDVVYMRWTGGEAAALIEGSEVRCDRSGRIRHQLDWSLELHPTEDPEGRIALDALARTLLFELGRLGAQVQVDAVERARRWMRLHLAEPITLADTAAAAGLSRFHWVRACKRATGMTPMRLLMRLRCEAAQVLLESSDLPLTDIAAETGFADASHLSHRYRLMMGCAPGALRRRR